MPSLIDYSHDECSSMHYTASRHDMFNYGGDITLLDDLQIAYSSLSENNTFVHLNFHPSTHELSAINALHIDQDSIEHLDHHGAPFYPYRTSHDLTNLYSGTKAYLESLSIENKDVSAVIANFINNTVSSVINRASSDSAIVEIRASTANTDVYIPAWHTDGCPGDNLYQMVITLKGASTLFYDLSKDLREEYNSIEQQLTPYSDYRYSTAKLFDHSKTSSVTDPGYGSAFLCNHNDNGAFHTTPATYEERLFMLISPQHFLK